MIIDALSNAGKYLCVHPLFERVFEYIKSVNINSIEEGNYELQGDEIKAIVSNQPGRSLEEGISRFECHDKYIDIQLCISGQERIGWKPRRKCTQQKAAYDESKDVIFFNDAPDMYFELTNDQFVIFFPHDVHAPMIGEGKIKKMIIKVKYTV
ncbi:YhcH/YjgK/YiaL family protein [Agriterribacter sp.]|uniref:YhcH/YjgK/YiaL family protein n=1 Tax=Agriterribacter sp. TaxID=2821509 RepID=UPI002C74CF45|nr:YhcH/YjgK/YiaL family protein [Agriterribacter sp.]HRP55913.1 YhcH/YjgK/YiaL family protein [Agriterribacter sp.]